MDYKKMNLINSKRLKIAIFLDHDIMIRHFIHSRVFNKLSKKHKVDFIFPPKENKRITLDPSGFIEDSGLYRLSVHEMSRSLWGRMNHVLILRQGFDKYSIDLKRAWRLVTPLKIELFHIFLSLPFIFQIYKRWTEWQSDKNPNLALRELLSKNKYDLLINPGIPNGVYIDDLILESKKATIPLIYIMNSWDNPLSGPFRTGKPDLFLAWGPQTVNHAIRYQGLEENKTISFGAAQFEIYKKPPKMNREEFCAKHGIISSKKIILYAGGSLGTNEFEHLKLLEEQIEKGAYGDSIIIYRPHPWGGGGNKGERIAANEWKHVYIEYTMKEYLEGLRKRGYHLTFPDYTDTHVVLSSVDYVISPLSTILIEAALHGKPVMCFLPMEEVAAKHFQTVQSFPHFREFQNQEEVVLAKNRKELVDKVKLLFNKKEDPMFQKNLLKSCEFFVSTHDLPYEDRLIEIAESMVINQ